MSSLSPAVVAAIRDLELAARLVVDGIRAGSHRSPLHGYSAEFQQHRPYRSGDDLKHLDWKLLARTDRLYLRQFRETTSLGAMIILDTSASMAFPADGLSKFGYARIIAAALAYLISTQGDAVGLMALEDGALSWLPARGGRPHLRALLARLDRLEAKGQWQPERVVARGAELLRRRGLVIVISDFYDDEETTRRVLRRTAGHGHDVTALQIISEAETEFPYRGNIAFEDMESGERRLVDATTLQETYRASVRSFLERSRRNALQDGLDYALFSTEMAPAPALREFLLRRGAPRASGHADQRERR
jgi:uncharacterized protein (DUF58 family)